MADAVWIAVATHLCHEEHRLVFHGRVSFMDDKWRTLSLLTMLSGLPKYCHGQSVHLANVDDWLWGLKAREAPSALVSRNYDYLSHEDTGLSVNKPPNLVI
jgi:hypothetical protein